MIKATKEFLAAHEALCAKRKAEILGTGDEIEIDGKVYYVSNDGDDANDGLSPERPWKTLGKVSEADLKAGDGVRFKRGDLFRGRPFCVKVSALFFNALQKGTHHNE